MILSPFNKLSIKFQNKNYFNCAYISITDNCNLACAYCFSKNNNFIKLSDYKTLLKILQKKNVFYIILTGGEPFVHKNIRQIILLNKKYNFSTIIFTSGLLINNKNINFLINKNIQLVSLSLYHHTPEKNFLITQNKDYFNNVLKAAKLLKKNKIKYEIKLIPFKKIYKNDAQLLESFNFFKKNNINFITGSLSCSIFQNNNLYSPELKIKKLNDFYLQKKINSLYIDSDINFYNIVIKKNKITIK